MDFDNDSSKAYDKIHAEHLHLLPASFVHLPIIMSYTPISCWHIKKFKKNTTEQPQT